MFNLDSRTQKASVLSCVMSMSCLSLTGCLEKLSKTSSSNLYIQAGANLKKVMQDDE